jgi:hypothetical protein
MVIPGVAVKWFVQTLTKKYKIIPHYKMDIPIFEKSSKISQI